MALRQEAVDRQAGGNRVLGVADEFSILLRKAARLAHDERMAVDDVELVAAGVIEVDLVRRDQRAERLRIVFQERDRRPVRFGRRVKRKIDAPDDAPSSPRRFAQAGNTFMIELFVVVTPKK